MPPLEALPTPVEEVLRRGVQSLTSFTSSHPPGPAWALLSSCVPAHGAPCDRACQRDRNECIALSFDGSTVTRVVQAGQVFFFYLPRSVKKERERKQTTQTRDGGGGPAKCPVRTLFFAFLSVYLPQKSE